MYRIYILLITLLIVILHPGCVSESKIETAASVVTKEAPGYMSETPVAFCTDTRLDSSVANSQIDYRDAVIQACIQGDYESGAKAIDAYNAQNSLLDNSLIPVEFDSLMLVSKIVEQEAGSDWLSDEHQQYVASVLINRVNSPEFPDTLEACVFQKGQYAGVNGAKFKELIPGERSVENALTILESGSITPASVVFQSSFKQGSGVWKVIPDEYLKTTYFCYSSYPELYESEVK